MKTQYYAAASLDGFIAASNHSLDWLLQFGDIDETSYPDFIQHVGAIAMGSATYEWILNNQIFTEENVSNPWPYEQPAWIFTSRSLPKIDGADIRFASGDVRPIHQKMVKAAGDKNIWIMGGGELVGQFYDYSLIDELIIQVASVTLGEGFPLLPRKIIKPPLKLKAATTYGKYFAELRYEIPK